MDDLDIDAPGSPNLDAPPRDSSESPVSVSEGQSSRIDRSQAMAAADISTDIINNVQQGTVGKLRVCHNLTFTLHFANNCSFVKRKCILLAGRCKFFKLALEHDLSTAMIEGDLEASTYEMLA